MKFKYNKRCPLCHNKLDKEGYCKCKQYRYDKNLLGSKFTFGLRRYFVDEILLQERGLRVLFDMVIENVRGYYE